MEGLSKILSIVPIHRVGLTIPKPPPNTTVYYDSSYKSSTKPLTAFSSDRSRQPPHRSGSIQSRVSTSAVPPGHVPINLQDGSREEWARHIKHALNHPDRMRAANELKAEERPQPTTSIPQDEYDAAREQLHQVDPRIPVMYLRRLSNCSSAPTSFRTTTSPLAMSVNFLIPTCLHSLCHCQKSVDSRCHLLLTNNIITPGHSVTARPSKPLN